MSILPKIEGGVRMRYLLLGSLALNLFFVGAAGAVALRYTSPVPLATVARIDHNLASRLDRIASSLPPADCAASTAARASSDSSAMVKTIPGRTTPDFSGSNGNVTFSFVMGSPLYGSALLI